MSRCTGVPRRRGKGRPNAERSGVPRANLAACCATYECEVIEYTDRPRPRNYNLISALVSPYIVQGACHQTAPLLLLIY